MYKTHGHMQGIALVQVLFLSAIITIMLFSVIKQSKDHVKTAELLQQRAEAVLALNTLEAETTFALSTQDRVVKTDSALEITRDWNFYNVPFMMPEGAVQIQDLSGLGSVFHTDLVVYLLASVGVAEDDLKVIAQGLKSVSRPGGEVPKYLDQFVKPSGLVTQRHTPLQQIEELRFYPGVSSSQFEQVKRLLTTFPITQFNYLTMPDEILSFYLDDVELKAVLQAREQHSLTAQIFSDITGLHFDQDYGSTVGRGLRLSFTASGKDVKLRRQADVVLDPYASEPITYWEYHKYHHVE